MAHFCRASLAVLSLLGAASIAQADDCTLQTVEHVRALGARTDVEVRHDGDPQRPWSLRVGSRSIPLPAVPVHAHLIVFVPRGSSQIAVVRASAGHDLERRVLVYDLDGRLVRSIDLQTLLSPAAVERIRTNISISHLSWLAPNAWRLLDDGRTVELRPSVGPAVRFSL